MLYSRPIKKHYPEIIRKQCFGCLGSLNEYERIVAVYGEESLRKQLDLDNDDAEVWKLPSGDKEIGGWNIQCIPSLEWIVYKLEEREEMAKHNVQPTFHENRKTSSELRREEGQRARGEIK
jgi:hypothetical protein